jgi:uncharacterized protein YcbK (DUF882 family)
MYHTHTNERLEVVFRRGNAYVPEGLRQLNRFLRDSRTAEVHTYDPKVFDLLYDLEAAVGRPNAEIEIICGYRTPKTNEYLRSTTRGVAKSSRHARAEAIDFRILGTNTAFLRDTALELRRGGVGYYATSNFIHVDVGPVRRW